MKQIFPMNGKVYAVCGNCGRIIRFDKPLIGSLHFCTTEAERDQFGPEIVRRMADSVRALQEGK
jgi:hypothetical protein